MKGWDWAVLLFAVSALVAWYLSYTAARIDRLHARVEGTLSALDAQLVRRAEATIELANSGALDPASAFFLASEASNSLEAAEEPYAKREAIESELSEAIVAALPPELTALMQPADAAVERGDTADDAVGRAALERLLAAGQRVQLARRFHNDAVTDVVRIRRKAAVRWFRLAGFAELPPTVEFDDALPVRH